MKLPPKLPKRPARKRQAEPEIEWREYPLIQSREYPAYCKSAQRYRDPQFKRWTCLLRWDVLTDDLLTVIATVPQWFPLGSGENPSASCRGVYLKEWVRANGGPPKRGDRVPPRVFTRRMARVEVGDTDPQKSPVPYSVGSQDCELGNRRGFGSISQQVTQSRTATLKGHRHRGFQRVIVRS
jgi:hypothetical protein